MNNNAPKPTERHSVTTPARMHDFVIDYNWTGQDFVKNMIPWTCVKCGELRRLPQEEFPVNSFGCSEKLLPTMNLVRPPLPTPEFYSTNIYTHPARHYGGAAFGARSVLVGMLVLAALCSIIYGIANVAMHL